ncbi:BolA protein [Fonticula alba]|uniref:BolA protein n=1 Tax=Fonticula alba TaxID=691883 RepID=A0A058Z7N5_FONAL|nr:BolA protein [Fonticula alba]KCV69507.1 BolA protein [Fonticula alba]|eukprot:XP_009496072.1 BolA protein [Fonticula alba]
MFRSVLPVTSRFARATMSSVALPQGAQPVYTAINQKLVSALAPSFLVVRDDSRLHAGHAAMRGSPHRETHFDVTVVSDAFAGKTLIQRHRLIYGILAEELNEQQGGTVHALTITAKTPAEFDRTAK